MINLINLLLIRLGAELGLEKRLSVSAPITNESSNEFNHVRVNKVLSYGRWNCSAKIQSKE